MTLKKAREIIQLNIKEAGRTMPPDVRTALKISIEAIDRILDTRLTDPTSHLNPLPSESIG